jgi:hypothetical protein|tara:strand:- start:624 stop:2195 length:1572 start_codon:yes stop_codon:yes gene_type:complete
MEKSDYKKIINKFKENLPFYAKSCLKIVDKQGNLVPLQMNDAQVLLDEQINRQLSHHNRVRVLILKSRQTGISTYCQARGFWQTATKQNQNAVVVSHLAESTKAIFNMVRMYYDNLPHPIVQPDLKESTTSSLAFAHGSRWRIATARTAEVGRGWTTNYLHGSEVAFYPNADILPGLLQTVPDQGSEILLESTANGAGGWFYEACMRAIRGEGEWELCFIPWSMMPEYRRDPDPYFERTQEEDDLAEMYNLDDAQLNFRRLKIHDLGSEDLFRQEYPITPQEAFLTSGRLFVEPKFIDQAAKECYTPIWRGDLYNQRLEEHKAGHLCIFEHPQPSLRYCIGVDVSEGLEHGDYSCIQVLDHMGNQVATWHGHIDPFDFAETISQIALYYNRAWVLVERNNHGLTTIRKMQDMGYPNMYVEQAVDDAYVDRLTRRAGFLTTTKTKPLIIDNLAHLVRQGESGIACQDLISEMRSYVMDARGITNAQQGCYDDRIMAYAIALFGLNSMPRTHRRKFKNERRVFYN